MVGGGEGRWMKMPGGVRAKSVEPLKCAPEESHFHLQQPQWPSEIQLPSPNRQTRRIPTRQHRKTTRTVAEKEERQRQGGWEIFIAAILLLSQTVGSLSIIIASCRRRCIGMSQRPSKSSQAPSFEHPAHSCWVSLPTCTPLAHDASCIHNTTTPQHECLWGSIQVYRWFRRASPPPRLRRWTSQGSGTRHPKLRACIPWRAA